MSSSEEIRNNENGRFGPDLIGDELWTSIRNVIYAVHGKTKTVSNGRRDIKYQLLIAACIFCGLFFVEYPLLFLVGYWSWGPVVHKVLSGLFLVLNLALAEYARKKV